MGEGRGKKIANPMMAEMEMPSGNSSYSDFDSPRQKNQGEQKLGDKIKHVMKEFWLLMVVPGNATAGVGSAMHVNIYLLAIALVLSTPYLNAMATLQLAVLSTIILQVVQSFLSPYSSFVIANCDSVPAAVLAYNIQYIVDYMEAYHAEDVLGRQEEWDLLHASLNNTSGASSGPVMMDLGLRPQDTNCFEPADASNDCYMSGRASLLVCIFMANLTIGLTLLAVKGHAAHVVAFVPTTVQAAFLGGIGMKIFKMGVFFVADKATMIAMVTGKLEGEFSVGGTMFSVALVLVLAILILVAEEKLHHSKIHNWVWPLMLILFTACFHVILAIYSYYQDIPWTAAFQHAQNPNMTGSHFPNLPRNMGWLMDESNVDSHLLPQFDNFDPMKIKPFSVISSGQFANFLLLDIMTILSILLNSAAIEEETNMVINLNHEIRATGIGNLFASLASGFPGYASAQKSLLCHGMGGQNMAGLWSAGYFVLFWFFGFVLVQGIPLPVIGAFIAAIGMELLHEWIWEQREKLAKSERYELYLLFFIMCFNFIAGFCFGMVLSMIGFTARYVKTPVIRSAIDARSYQGKALRDSKSKTILVRYGSEVLSLRLQGFIFFFTAEKLRLQVQALLEAREKAGHPIKYLCIDFRMVEGLDATAVKKIRKIMNYTKEAGVQVLFCDVLPQMIHQMEHDEIDPHEYPNMTFHDDIDLGIEFACDQILLRPNHNFTFIKRTAEGAWKLKNIVKGIIQFQRLGFHDFVNGERFDSVSFRQAGKAQTFAKDEVIARQMDTVHRNPKLYFIGTGSVCKWVEDELGNRTRMEKRYAGTIIGEMSFFCNLPTHGTFIADEDKTTIYSFTKDSMNKLKDEYPTLVEHMLQHSMVKMADTIKRLLFENTMLKKEVMEEEKEDDEIVQDLLKEEAFKETSDASKTTPDWDGEGERSSAED